MSRKLLFLLISLLAVTSESVGRALDSEVDSANDSSLGNCLADALVLEGILLRASAELASGIFIPAAIKELKFFWSLLPEWFAECKGAFKAPDLGEGEFPEIDIEYTSEGLLIDGSLYTPNEMLEDFQFSSCVEALRTAAIRVGEVRERLAGREYQEAVDLIYSLEALTASLHSTCGSK